MDNHINNLDCFTNLFLSYIDRQLDRLYIITRWIDR